ncbi:MAG TPA: dihydrolipoyl dehydrogenase [Pirellulales bacterium]|nr:dihydrolipoyl dehydrogenase [Pirellulales bacterium]
MPEPNQPFDLIVIGAGPGGYTATIRAAQLGLNVAVIEKESALGGTCLRIGCIPSKALLESSELYWEAQQNFASHGVRLAQIELDLATMLSRKEQIVTGLSRGIGELFKKNKITRIQGLARFAGRGRLIVAGSAGDAELSAKQFVIATGSSSRRLPGVEFDGQKIGTSTEALSYDAVPKHLVVIGAGAIGLELGSVWRRLGTKVTVLEYLDRILPEMDAGIAAEAQKILTKQGLEFRLGTRVTGARATGEQCIVECEGQPPLECDRVLVAVGRVPNTEGLGLDAVGLKTDDRGRIEVDDHFETGAAGVFAIGDVIRGPMLAHKAEEEGVACVERIVTGYGHVNYDCIANVVYTQPEIASVGRSEEQLKQQGIAYRKGVFYFRANSRARVVGHPEGQVKMLADAETDRILGVHILGLHAGELIAEAATAISFGASSEDVARTCHAHPTLAEAIKEAALAVDGRAINS